MDVVVIVAVVAVACCSFGCSCCCLIGPHTLTQIVLFLLGSNPRATNPECFVRPPDLRFWVLCGITEKQEQKQQQQQQQQSTTTVTAAAVITSCSSNGALQDVPHLVVLLAVLLCFGFPVATFGGVADGGLGVVLFLVLVCFDFGWQQFCSCGCC